MSEHRTESNRPCRVTRPVSLLSPGRLDDEANSQGAMRISTQLKSLPKKKGPAGSISFSNASSASVNSLHLEIGLNWRPLSIRSKPAHFPCSTCLSAS